MLRHSAITHAVQYLCCSWTSQQQTSRNLQTSLSYEGSCLYFLLLQWNASPLLNLITICIYHSSFVGGTQYIIVVPVAQWAPAASCCHWKLLTSWTNATLRTGTKSSAALVCPSCCNSNGPACNWSLEMVALICQWNVQSQALPSQLPLRIWVTVMVLQQILHSLQESCMILHILSVPMGLYKISKMLE